MRIRIALGAVAGLAAVSAFVFLQFRAEALAQQDSPERPEPFSAQSDPFGSDDFFVSDESAKLVEPSDPFGDDSPLPKRSKSKSGQTVSSEPDAEGYDPFMDDSDVGSNGFDNAPRAKHQLRIIRLENVPVEVVYSVLTSLFVTNGEGADFVLSMENQSNSLIFRGPADKLKQITELTAELDRLATDQPDTRRNVYSYPIPHTVVQDNDDTSTPENGDWPIRIIRLRHVEAPEFLGIARNLIADQINDSQLIFMAAPSLNTVILRGPMAEITQIEELAKLLDEAASHKSGRDLNASTIEDSQEPYRSLIAGLDSDLDLDMATGWQVVEAPADQVQRHRQQITTLDRQSIQLASEIRAMQRTYSPRHPEIAKARARLMAQLETSFQSRLQLQGLEVSVLKSRLQQIESAVQQRAQLRKQIINRRLSELLGLKSELSWEVTQASPAATPTSPEDLQFTAPLDRILTPADYPEPVQDVAPTRSFVDPRPDVIAEPRPTPRDSATVDAGSRPRSSNTLFESDAGKIVPVPAEPTLAVQENPGLGGIIDRPSSELDLLPVNPETNLKPPVRNERMSFQQDLIVAESNVEIARLKFEKIASRLKEVKGYQQEKNVAYDLQIAKAELERAMRLLDQKFRLIKAQRNSLEVKLKLLETALEASEVQFKMMTNAIKNVPGVVPEVEIRQQELTVVKAKLQVEQAKSELRIFDIQNQTAQPGTGGADVFEVTQPAKKPSFPAVEADSGPSKDAPDAAETPLPGSDDSAKPRDASVPREQLPVLSEPIGDATSF
jgi:hypothetical protein